MTGLKPTPLFRVLLEKLTVAQLVNKFSAFYGTRMFITVFTRARHWSISWARWIQSSPSHAVSLRSILIKLGYVILFWSLDRKLCVTCLVLRAVCKWCHVPRRGNTSAATLAGWDSIRGTLALGSVCNDEVHCVWSATAILLYRRRVTDVCSPLRLRHANCSSTTSTFTLSPLNEAVTVMHASHLKRW
jgi:hypothetical protein